MKHPSRSTERGVEATRQHKLGTTPLAGSNGGDNDRPNGARVTGAELRRGLSPLARLLGWAEAHVVLTVFFVALAARSVLAVGVTIVKGGSLFPDDSGYPILAQAAADGR